MSDEDYEVGRYRWAVVSTSLPSQGGFSRSESNEPNFDPKFAFPDQNMIAPVGMVYKPVTDWEPMGVTKHACVWKRLYKRINVG